MNELFLKRQSCRNYDPSKIPDKEKILAVLSAGTVAPSARNTQPWHFTVCTGKSANKVRIACQYGGANAFLDNVNVFVVVTVKKSAENSPMPEGVTRQDFSVFDVGLAVENICLAATDEGLSSVIIGWLNCDEVKNIISATDEIKVVIALGYAQQGDVIREKKRRAVSESVDFLN